MVYDIMRRPHPLVSGNGHDELAAGLQAGGDAGKRVRVVRDMLDHVKRADQVEVTFRDAVERWQRRGADRASQALFGHAASGLVDLNRVHLSEC